MSMSSRLKVMGVFLLISLFFIGCASPMRGVGSVTLLTRDMNTQAKNIEVVGPVDQESDTFYWAAIFVMWGDPALTHEAPINRLLAKHKADLIMDAEITDSVFMIPYIFTMQKTTVKGTPARYREGK